MESNNSRFIPPDGVFELMQYRITENVDLPFRVIIFLQNYAIIVT